MLDPSSVHLIGDERLNPADHRPIHLNPLENTAENQTMMTWLRPTRVDEGGFL